MTFKHSIIVNGGFKGYDNKLHPHKFSSGEILWSTSFSIYGLYHCLDCVHEAPVSYMGVVTRTDQLVPIWQNGS